MTLEGNVTINFIINMKKLTFLFIMIISFAKAQKIEKNYTDDFTGSHIMKSDWEFLNNASNGFTAKFRLSKINGNHFLDLKMIIGTRSPKVFSIHEGDKLMFKLNNDEIVELESLTSETTCTGCGATGLVGSAAQGINISYSISQEQFEKLKTTLVSKVRIYTTDGYVENDVKEKHSKTIQKTFQLF